MATSKKLVEAFIREATEDANFLPVASLDLVYARLRALQKGAFTTATTDGGVVQISSKIGNDEFSFALPQGFGPADIIETAEEALQRVERAGSVAELRSGLVRCKTKRMDFSRLQV
jgi:hypothetical protein